MPEIIYGDQQTDEWFQHRIGSIGGSSISAVLAKGQGKMRQGLLNQFLDEILMNRKKEGFQSEDMKRGNLYEPEARDYYAFINGVDVVQCALIKSDIPRIHTSPDGLIGDDGGLEIKTQLPHVFLETLDTGKIDGTYIKQCQHFLWVSGRKWIDFMAYCPEAGNPAWIKRLERDEKMIKEIETECLKFIYELNALVERMR